MNNHKITFGGIDSSTYGVYISGSDTFSAPERDVRYVQVPGRNGDLIIDNGRWNNITVTYPAFIPNTFESNVDAFRAAMMLKTGYHRLEDTYHPNEYRMASFSYGLNPSNITAYRRFGEFALTFNCKPQRFLKSGETPLQFFPVLVSSTTWYSPYVPVNGTLKFTATTSSTLSVTLYTYNSGGTQQSSTNYSCANGAEKTKTFTSNDKYWRLAITGRSSTDTCYFTVVGNTTIDGKTVALNAKLGRNFTITNPTGYPAKPLIEFYNKSLANMAVDNYKDNVKEEWYSFRSNQMANGANHGFLDCDLQYLYDSTGANQTDKLVLTTAQAIAHSMVFPEFTGDTIQLQMYDITSSIDDGCGLIQIYPNWWTL